MSEVEKAMRAALRRLGDVVYLSHSPLAIMIADRAGWRLDGYTLQHALCQAIEALRPEDDWPFLETQQLRYDLLRLRYFERREIPEIAERLAISQRQYYRELKAAVWMLTEQVLGGG